MVDRIIKTGLTEGYRRVEGAQDALEQDQRQGSQQDGSSDGFDLLGEKTDWHLLFDQAHLWNQNLEVQTDEIEVIQFQGVNLKTDPSLLKVRVVLTDGTIIPNAFLSVSRAVGLQIKNLKRMTNIDTNRLTRNKSLWLTVPKDEKLLKEEITRVTQVVKEHTLSQTIKKFLVQRNLLQKMGIQDPVSQRINNEILIAYVTIFTLFMAFLFGLFVLS